MLSVKRQNALNFPFIVTNLIIGGMFLFKMIGPKIFKATVKNNKSPKCVAEKKLFGEKFHEENKEKML